MILPNYTNSEDPGPDFAALVRLAGLDPAPPDGPVDARLSVTHGTTCVAVRYGDGVVMAGDRRATSGNFISHRHIEKVFPADRHSGVAIAGAAGPAVEMVRLFQLQLEHYEKVEGSPLSLEGKANQLSQMVRNHLPAAMQGLAVVPIFAGYDTGRNLGRLFQYDVTGGRYEESDHATTGSGSLHATTVIKLGWRDGMDGDAAIDLALRSLHEAADEDSATGGADMVRGIYPVVATISGSGYERIEDAVLAGRYATLLETLADERGGALMTAPFYVAPEQMMKDRADYARKGIARGRALVACTFDDGILVCAENPSRMLRKISEIYDRIAFAGVGKYNEFDQLRIAGVRHADLKGFSFSREDVDARSLANQYAQMLGQVFTHEMKPMEVEILVAEVGHEPDGDQLFHILYDGTLVDETGWCVLGGEAEAIGTRMGEAWTEGCSRSDALQAAVGALAGADRTLGPAEIEAAVLERSNGRRSFRRVDDDEVTELLDG